jgi:hypothetical protein
LLSHGPLCGRVIIASGTEMQVAWHELHSSDFTDTCPHSIFVKTNKLRYNKIDHKTQITSGANSYMIPQQGAIIRVVQNKQELAPNIVFLNLFYCNLISEFCWFLKIWNVRKCTV